MNDIMKSIKSVEKSGLLITGVTKTIKSETKKRKGGILGMLLGSLGARLLENLLTGKGTIRAAERAIVTSHGKVQLEQARIFNAALSFGKFWNKKALSK